MVNLLAVPLRFAIGAGAGFGTLIAAALAIFGLLLISDAFKYSLITRIVLFILMFIPVINIIALVIVNSRVTRALRTAGYQVGLLGARK